MIRVLFADDCAWKHASIYRFESDELADAFLKGVCAVCGAYSTDGCRTYKEGEGIDEWEEKEILAALAADDKKQAKA